VPTVTIELDDGDLWELVPRGNVRVVRESRENTMKITKRQLRQIIRESIEVMNSDTGEMLYLPDSYADRYEDGQEVPDREFGPLYDEVSAATPEDEDTLFDPEEALEELRATAQTMGGDWALDNPGRSLDDVAYDLASSIKWSVSEKTWEIALEIFDYNEEELIWSLAEAMA